MAELVGSKHMAIERGGGGGGGFVRIQSYYRGTQGACGDECDECGEYWPHTYTLDQFSSSKEYRGLALPHGDIPISEDGNLHYNAFHSVRRDM